MEGLDAMHDEARGWSPRQQHRLASYMLGADVALDGGFSEALRDDAGGV